MRIYEDCWLLGDSGGKILSLNNILPIDTVASDMIVRDSGWWNNYLLDNLFYPFEAQKIKSITLCNSTQNDYFSWPLTNDRDYSVKTGS